MTRFVPDQARGGPAQRRARPGDCICGHPEALHGNDVCRVLACTCSHMMLRPKRRKYGNVPCVGPLGELYDSKAERDYAAKLQGDPRVAAWSWAPRFVLQDNPLITYRPDFVVWLKAADPFIVDVKGHAARDFSLRVRLWRARYPNVPLCIVKNGSEEWQ